MENLIVSEIFKNIQDEFGQGSYQYYSSVTKTHYLYVSNRLIFLIHSDEIGETATCLFLYIIKYGKETQVPEEISVKIPFSELENYIYRYISENLQQ